MVKLSLAAVAAATLCMSDAPGQGNVHGSHLKDRKCENYLPLPNVPTVPWLELNTNTKLPEGDIALDRDVASIGWFVRPPVDADIRVYNNVTPTSRSL